MSGDPGCLGLCMIDWDTGVCMGCGRGAEEISGIPTPAPARDSGSPAAAPLPPNVAGLVGEGSE